MYLAIPGAEVEHDPSMAGGCSNR